MLCIPSRFTNVHSILLLLDLQPPVFLLALLHAVMEVDVTWETASVISYVLYLMTAATTSLKCHASQVHTDFSQNSALYTPNLSSELSHINWTKVYYSQKVTQRSMSD